MNEVPHDANNSELERAALAQTRKWGSEAVERAQSMEYWASVFSDSPEFRKAFDEMMERLRKGHVHIADLAAGEHEPPLIEEENGFPR